MKEIIISGYYFFTCSASINRTPTQILSSFITSTSQNNLPSLKMKRFMAFTPTPYLPCIVQTGASSSILMQASSCGKIYSISIDGFFLSISIYGLFYSYGLLYSISISGIFSRLFICSPAFFPPFVDLLPFLASLFFLSCSSNYSTRSVTKQRCSIGSHVKSLGPSHPTHFILYLSTPLIFLCHHSSTYLLQDLLHFIHLLWLLLKSRVRVDHTL